MAPSMAVSPRARRGRSGSVTSRPLLGIDTYRDEIVAALVEKDARKGPWRRSLKDAPVSHREVSTVAGAFEPIPLGGVIDRARQMRAFLAVRGERAIARSHEDARVLRTGI